MSDDGMLDRLAIRELVDNWSSTATTATGSGSSPSGTRAGR